MGWNLPRNRDTAPVGCAGTSVGRMSSVVLLTNPVNATSNALHQHIG